jgi:hypothetical protein
MVFDDHPVSPRRWSAHEAFARDGFALVPDTLAPAALEHVDRAVARLPSGVAGTRGLLEQAWCRALAQTLRAHPAIAAALPASHVAVQCTAFEKSASRNWLVALHQDLSIPVAERVDEPSLRGWARKEGAWFVRPPLAVLEALVAVRLHLDDCGDADGPLQVVAGSHRHGVVPDHVAFALRAASPPRACTLQAGGAMLLRPLLLHASSKATGTSRRRVLHFVYGPAALPCGLRWGRPRAATAHGGSGHHP